MLKRSMKRHGGENPRAPLPTGAAHPHHPAPKAQHRVPHSPQRGGWPARQVPSTSVQAAVPQDRAGRFPKTGLEPEASQIHNRAGTLRDPRTPNGHFHPGIRSPVGLAMSAQQFSPPGRRIASLSENPPHIPVTLGRLGTSTLSSRPFTPPWPQRQIALLPTCAPLCEKQFAGRTPLAG